MADAWPRVRSPSPRYPCCHSVPAPSNATPATLAHRGWPNGVREVWYDSPGAGGQQPTLFYTAPYAAPRPLLVALHAWSGNHLSGDYGASSTAHWCVREGWHFVHPNFLGAGCRPEACGSEWAVTSIIDAVRYAHRHAVVDRSRVYAIGGSGGGMAALLLAGRAPHLWTAVSAWASIGSLAEWHRRCPNPKYHSWIECCVGGNPSRNASAAQAADARSAVSYLRHARGVPLDINAGLADGHSRNNPVLPTHSALLFNQVAHRDARLNETELALLASGRPPATWAAEPAADAAYPSSKRVLLRRSSGLARFTVFAGGHETLYDVGLRWLAQHHRRNGTRHVWTLGPSALSIPS